MVNTAVYDLLILLLCSIVLQRAFHEWLKYELPVMERVIWFVLVPSYACIAIATVLLALFPSPTFFLSFLLNVSTTVFLYSGLLYALLILLLQMPIMQKK